MTEVLGKDLHGQMDVDRCILLSHVSRTLSSYSPPHLKHRILRWVGVGMMTSGILDGLAIKWLITECTKWRLNSHNMHVSVGPSRVVCVKRCLRSYLVVSGDSRVSGVKTVCKKQIHTDSCIECHENTDLTMHDCVKRE